MMPVLEALSWCVTLKEEGPERRGKAACLENPGHREQMFLGLPNIFPFPFSGPAGVGAGKTCDSLIYPFLGAGPS